MISQTYESTGVSKKKKKKKREKGSALQRTERKKTNLLQI
jgi:hypothetical protein